MCLEFLNEKEALRPTYMDESIFLLLRGKKPHQNQGRILKF